ncbi:MAG: NCS2 family permease [Verrucomicrobiota bacterium]
MKRFVKGDLDGLFALGLDNLVTLLLIGSLWNFVLGFEAEILFTKVFPANAVGLLVGNLIFSRMAHQLAEREGREDVCALPYGINLLTILVFTFAVMLPAKLGALSEGLSEVEAQEIAWQIGLVVCLVSGLVETLGSLVVVWLQRVTPRAALLSAIAGIGLFFISADYFFRSYSHPLVGLPTLLLILILFFGRMHFRVKVPGGLIVLALGTLIAWAQAGSGLSGAVVPGSPLAPEFLGFHLPLPAVGEIWQAWAYLPQFLPVALSMGMVSLTGSLMNLESAEAAGDRYPARPALLVNGIGSMATALFGSPYPTTIYIGHPGWKALGARAGYSTLNAALFTVVLLTGSMSFLAWLIPIEAGMAILIWIGLMMTVQAFDKVPRAHMPAVAIGFLPALAAFVNLYATRAIGAVGETGQASAALAEAIELPGLFALSAGYLYTSLLWAALVVAIIERRFLTAAVWALGGSLLAALGFIHGYTFEYPRYAEVLQPSLEWSGYYLLAALVLAGTPFFMRRSE